MKAVFFRNDDLGWEHARFRRLLDLFHALGFKLNAAAIPIAAAQTCRPGEFDGCRAVLQIHAHGFRHENHEPFGKKAEFGRARATADVAQELVDGHRLLRDQFGELFFPAFTPPWNRIEDRFLPAVAGAGFKVLSRDGPPRTTAPLLELNIALDLHTDRLHPERTVAEWVQIIDRERPSPFGIMLHHGRMEEGDFERLRHLLQTLRRSGVTSLFFSECAAAQAPPSAAAAPAAPP